MSYVMPGQLTAVQVLEAIEAAGPEGLVISPEMRGGLEYAIRQGWVVRTPEYDHGAQGWRAVAMDIERGRPARPRHRAPARRRRARRSSAVDPGRRERHARDGGTSRGAHAALERGAGVKRSACSSSGMREWSAPAGSRGDAGTETSRDSLRAASPAARGSGLPRHDEAPARRGEGGRAALPPILNRSNIARFAERDSRFVTGV
jgi:hypothetical protein